MKTQKSLLDCFPHYVRKANGEFATPCPFCDGQGVSFKGRRFVGDDRLVWFHPPSVLYCRHCGVHTYEELTRLFFGSSAVFDFESLEPLETSRQLKLILADEDYVRWLHERVVRDYWRAFGWSDIWIDRRLLGFGTLYRHSQRSPRHIIPFRLTSLPAASVIPDGYALEGRLPPDSSSPEPRNIKTAGISKHFIWHEFGGDFSEGVVITEGLKDGITAQHFSRNVVSFFGATTDLRALAAWLNTFSFPRVTILTDNDDAGIRYRRVLSSELTAREIFYLDYPGSCAVGFDLTNFFEQGVRDFSPLLRRHVELPTRGYVPDYRLYDPEYVPKTYPPSSLEDLRAQMRSSVEDYLDSYRQRYFRKIKVLAAPPGSGKSHILVEMAEHLAADRYDRFHAQTEKPENFSLQTVLYAGPFLSGWEDIQRHQWRPELWMNFEARNSDNCQNLPAVTAYAEKGYNALNFCRVLCPFYAACKQTGYLAQEQRLKEKPIAYVRHHNLLHPSFIKPYQTIIIDENPLSVFDEPFVVSVDDLRPTSDAWFSYVTVEQANLLLRFIGALRGAFEDGLFGASFLKKIDLLLGGDLRSLLVALDDAVVDAYQAEVLIDEQAVFAAPKKCLARIVAVIREEYPKYADQQTYNSRLFVVGGNLLVYFCDVPHFSRNKRVIIADGTANPELYQILFRRPVDVFDPEFVNPESKTIVYSGSDFTRSYLESQIGPALRDFHRWLQERRTSFVDVLDNVFDDLGELEISDDFYNSPSVSRAFQLIVLTAEKHASLLVVTYKYLRPLLQRRLQSLHPELSSRVVFGHYGSLRGTNRYQHIEAALLIGCHRLPYQQLYTKICAYAAFAGLPKIEYDLISVPVPYDGRHDGSIITTFSDPFAQRFVDMVERGEAVQCLERIRLHTSDAPKTAYLAMNRPVARAVTDVVSLQTLINRQQGDKMNDVERFVREYFQQHRAFPRYAAVIERFRVSSKTVAKVFNRLKGDQQLMRG